MYNQNGNCCDFKEETRPKKCIDIYNNEKSELKNDSTAPIKTSDYLAGKKYETITLRPGVTLIRMRAA